MSSPSTWESERDVSINGAEPRTAKVVFYEQPEGQWFAFVTFEIRTPVRVNDVAEFDFFGVKLRGRVTNVIRSTRSTPIVGTRVRIQAEP